MLHPKSGIILILREHDCTMLQFAPQTPMTIKHANDCLALTDYLNQHPNHPLYVLLDPPYQSVQHLPLPPLKPWDRYLYLRRLLTERQTSTQLCGNLPIHKHHTTAGFVTCEKTQGLMAWLELLGKSSHPIISVSFKCIEALHWLKWTIPKWNRDWHILICQEPNQNLMQLAFYQGQLWMVRQTNNHDTQTGLQATLSYIRKLPHISVQRISVHMMDQAGSSTTFAKILGPQTTCDYIDCQKYLKGTVDNFSQQNSLLDAAVGISLWHAQSPNTNVKVDELARQKRLYTLPRHMLKVGSSLTTLLLICLVWMPQTTANKPAHPLETTVVQTVPSLVSSTNILKRLDVSHFAPISQLKTIAPALKHIGLIQIHWENTAKGGQIKLLMNASDKNVPLKLKRLQTQLVKKLPKIRLDSNPIDGAYCLELIDVQI